jgi:hypothetical protein
LVVRRQSRQTSCPLAASLDTLLEHAPPARLAPRFFLTILVAKGEALPRDALRELAAGVVVGFLAASAAVWLASSLGLLGGQEDWCSAIAEYTHLYTNETFSRFDPDAAMQAAELSAVGAKMGAILTPENVALPNLRFTTAFMLSYGGFPLGVIAYVDPSGAPVLLCILANRARMRRRAQSNAATFRSPGGRAAGARI